MQIYEIYLLKTNFYVYNLAECGKKVKISPKICYVDLAECGEKVQIPPNCVWNKKGNLRLAKTAALWKSWQHHIRL